MMRIRQVQLKLDQHYLEDEMKTPIHLCIGQEAIPVGVCGHLTPKDYISSNHRGHGHYLAKGGDLKGLFAELFCREHGCSKGRGGSMHLVDTAVGHYGSSSIVGGGIPIATGMGLAIKMQNQNLVSVAFFGDGAADEGVFYESLNFAILKKLPVIFILENNQYSICSHVSRRQASQNIFHKMPPELLWTCKIDGNDVVKVYNAARRAVTRARSGLGPSFIECETYRLGGHAGCAAQDAKGYRPAEEVKLWEERCPIRTLKEYLLAQGSITPGKISEMEEGINQEIEEAFEYARQSPLPVAEDLHLYLFCE